MRRLAGLVVVILTLGAACGRRDGRIAPTPTPPASAALSRDAGPPAANPLNVPRTITKLEPLDQKAACALHVDRRGSTTPGAKPYARADGTCPEPFCDWVVDPPTAKDTCFVASKNIARAEREGRAPAPVRAVSAPWDGRSPPLYWDRVDGHLHLGDDEAAVLRKNGFVALDRLGYGSYAVAFHDVFQEQLPVYVSADAILNAVFQASQMLLQEVEVTRLGPALGRMLDRMKATLRASRARYPAETWSDLDVYLSVADALFRSEPKALAEADAPAVQDLLARVELAQLDEVAIFGRARMIDFSQLVPRGHYTDAGWGPNVIKLKGGDVTLARYFRAMMWLSRLEYNLVSRSCRSSQPGMTPDASETPREARDALALAELVQRSGSLDDLRLFESTYSVFAGRREDVSVTDLLALAQKAKIAPSDPDAPTKLKAAIGDGWKRTARIHYMPEGAGELPAIATLFGPRIVPDVAPLTGLVHDKLPGRDALGAADVAYVLGHDRAKAHLAGDLAKFPALGAALDKARADFTSASRGRSDVYSAWISAVARLADAPSGVVPSFMRSEAYADLRMSSALAGYAQIRHTFVLLAGEGYDAYGCEIPDGWVEPAIGVYDALLGWVRAARTVAPGRAAYFRRVEEVLGMLRRIGQTELTGGALSEAHKRWLGMVSEYTPVGGYAGDSGTPPKWTGWYFDLFPDREHGAERAVDLVADYFTLSNRGTVRYLGIEKAVLGAFVVDTGGAPRVMVGPLARPYETEAPIAGRLDDEAARALHDRSAPWTASYLAASKPEPPIATQLVICGDEARVVVSSAADRGPVTIRLLDHHGDPVSDAITRDVNGGNVAFAFAAPPEMLEPRGIEGIHIRVEDLAHAKVGTGRWDFVAGVSVYPTMDPYPRKQAAYGLDVSLGTP